VGWPINDPIVQNAVSAILERSERQELLGQLEATFVDPGITARLANDNNEIVYGRRGTGKTHVLKVLQRQIGSKPSRLCLYLDMRVMGSDSIWASDSRPHHQRVANLLRDLLKAVHDGLLEYVTRPGVELERSPYEALDCLAQAMTDEVLSGEMLVTEYSGTRAADTSSSAELAVDLKPHAAVSAGRSRHVEQSARVQREGKPSGRILFQEVQRNLAKAIEAAELTHLVVLIDEWTAVPALLQPLLAEFIARAFLPSTRLTVKIAALEYRSTFATHVGMNNVIGFELGSDISASLELDDYFVFDRDNVSTIKLFSELLRRHVDAECESHWLAQQLAAADRKVPSIEHIREVLERNNWKSRYMEDKHGVKGRSEFVGALFDKEETFEELVRAGEGVPRDFMNIFRGAFFDSLKRQEDSIDRSAIRKAARDWYHQDKARNITRGQRAVLERIVNLVVGQKHARSFLFDAEVEGSDMIQSLFDNRVIHLVQRGYIEDPTRPGKTYNVYTLDFGTYVKLLGTDHAPRGDFTVGLADPDGVVVPFHDDRAIRKIEIPPEMLIPDETDRQDES